MEKISDEFNSLEKNVRIQWVDSLRFLGIFAIYIGHLGASAGRIYPFVYTYHVPLFFFVSGLFAMKYVEEDFWTFLKKHTRKLLVPYFVFSAISMLILTVKYQYDVMNILVMIKQALFGIRGKLYAGSLWFIPCLFVVTIYFHATYRILKNKWLVLLVSLGTFIISEHMMSFRPFITPKWIFNIDSALYYFVYYVLGVVSFEVLSKFKFEELVKWKKCLLGIISILIIGFACAIFYRKHVIILGVINKIPLIEYINPILIACTGIYINILAATFLSKISIFRNMGKNTLFLCGNETITKEIIISLLGALGISVVISNAITAILYAFGLLCIGYFIIIPLEKRIFPRIFK